MNLRNWGSIGKIIGTIVCVSGAAVMALLEGPKLLNMRLGLGIGIGGVDFETRLIGCLLVFGSSCCWSLALILQVRTCYRLTVNNIYIIYFHCLTKHVSLYYFILHIFLKNQILSRLIWAGLTSLWTGTNCDYQFT